MDGSGFVGLAVVALLGMDMGAFVAEGVALLVMVLSAGIGREDEVDWLCEGVLFIPGDFFSCKD